MSEWAEVTIGDICKRVVSGGTPLTSEHEYYLNGNIPWLKTKEVNQCRIYSTENHITQLGLENSSAKLIPINSVTVAMYGDGQTAGRVGLTKIPLATNQACCNLIIDENIADAEFVFYHLFGSYDELVARKTGSGQQNLNAQLIKAFEIPLPPLSEQKAIAAVLSSLDNKIDLLHRQNQTLEAMAATLFRQWFVEEAQEDWKAGTLGNVVDFNYGKTLKDQERSGSGYPVVGSSGVVGFHKDFLVEAPGIVTGRKGTLGVVNYFFDNFFPIDTTFYITSKIQSDGMFYEYFLVKSVGLGDMNSDSAVPGLNRNAAHAIPVTIPPSELVSDFNNFCKPTFAKINTNIRQIRTLEKLRDTLLPKLMNGEVRVTA